MSEIQQELLKLDYTWTKNTTSKINIIYTKLIECIKIDEKEQYIKCMEELKLYDPAEWFIWAIDQHGVKTIT
jgi:hypothetical protein